MGIPKKRIPTPKRGPNGVLYDTLHKAWRAGVITDFRYHEDTTWNVHGHTCASRADAQQIIERLLAAAGVASLEWGPMWLGRRDVVVTRSDDAPNTEGNRVSDSALDGLLDQIIEGASALLVTLRAAA